MSMHGSSGSKTKLDFELNIIPVIDFLTILVTFMLAAGIYYSIAMLDIRLSAPGTEVSVTATPDVNIEVGVGADKVLTLKVNGKATLEETYPRTGTAPNINSLKDRLKGLSAQWPSVKSVTIASNREASYQDVVTVLEAVRKSHPDVVLGGF